jgi:hypothetical protein
VGKLTPAAVDVARATLVAGVTVELLEPSSSELSIVDVAIDAGIDRAAVPYYLAGVELIGRVVADAAHVLALDRAELTARLGAYSVAVGAQGPDGG